MIKATKTTTKNTASANTSIHVSFIPIEVRIECTIQRIIVRLSKANDKTGLFVFDGINSLSDLFILNPGGKFKEDFCRKICLLNKTHMPTLLEP